MLFNSDLPFTEKRFSEHLKNVINNSIDQYENKIKILQSKLDEKTGIVLPVQYDLLALYKQGRKYTYKDYHPSSSNYYFNEKEQYKQIAELVKKFYDERLEACKKAHEENLPAIENNKNIRNQVINIMSNLGIPSTFKTSKYSRHKTVYSTENAGYIEDLQRNVLTSDNFSCVEETYKQDMTNLYEYVIKFEKEIQKEKAIQDAKEKETKELTPLVKLAAKYNIEITELKSNVIKEQILDVLLEKDKYLRLSYYLQKNREDWNDGYSYAECGLNNFPIEDEIDQLIEDEIKGLISSSIN